MIMDWAGCRRVATGSGSVGARACVSHRSSQCSRRLMIMKNTMLKSVPKSLHKVLQVSPANCPQRRSLLSRNMLCILVTQSHCHCLLPQQDCCTSAATEAVQRCSWSLHAAPTSAARLRRRCRCFSNRCPPPPPPPTAPVDTSAVSDNVSA